ncbi:OB-fold protein [Roseivirga sp.]|uniref:OB-fold protein n=1 Tax=Roseivirga sp. TaxID=1964215 RepID=UPI003B8D3197
MKKKSILIIVIIVGLIAAYLVYDNFLRTAPAMKRLDADHQVNAVQLYNEFDANEEASNQKYLNKIVEVTGEISEIETPEGSLPIISLKTGGFGVIKCTMEAPLDNEELQKIRLNSSITLKAECIGLLLDVLLIRGIINNN